MKVLVAYASRHGATAGIAERIAKRLERDGHPATAQRVDEVSSVGEYDAVVLGAGVYVGRWQKGAAEFASKHQKALAARPVWLFSSGPLGTDPVDKDGRDILESSRPKEFASLDASIRPLGDQVFFGAFDPDSPPQGVGERVIRALPAARSMLPSGDFRDWDAIDEWADTIAARLAGTGA